MDTTARELYEHVCKVMQPISDLQAAAALLEWDQETYMPPAAAAARAEQLATVHSLVHSLLISDATRQLAEEVRSLLPQLDGQLDAMEKGVLRTFVRDVERAAALPEDFVRRKARTTALAQEAWKQARRESSFAIFRDHLARIIDLVIEEAEYRGYKDHPYDALLDLYEPGLTVRQLDPVFARLQGATQQILEFVRSAPQPDDAVLFRYYPAAAQLEAARHIVEALGFRFDAGRVDLSAHPFCTSFAAEDVRLTTRINEHDIRSCLFGLIHEAGHGLYEQGIDRRLARTFARGGSSMGLHESQSLFWENIIARSEEFWHWALPILQRYFPEQLAAVTPAQMYAAINRVQPSLIRIEADEATYNLHIILRYELEKALVTRSLSVDEVPERWRIGMRELLGVEVPDDAQGCLQDIHWSFGGFGYFPSYTLGKLYAAMLRTALLEQIPEVPELVRKGVFAPIRQWLHEHVHRWGRALQPHELIVQVTGRPLTEEDFVAYLWAKVRRVYGGS